MIDALVLLLDDALADETHPVATAAACEVWRGGRLVHQSAHGRLDVDGEPITADTPFDVASLTKVMVTTALAMDLESQGAIDPEQPVESLLPEVAAPGRTLDDLLAHRAGYVAYRPWWHAARDDARCAALFQAPASRPALTDEVIHAARHHVLEAVLAEAPLTAAGEKAVYSDAGFIILAHALSRALHTSLEGWSEVFLRPQLNDPRLGDDDPVIARFVPHRAPRLVAPATRLADSRGERPIVGEVDDDNAFALGGVAGHAGLFANVTAVARFGEVVRRAHAGDTESGFDPAVVRRYLQRDTTTPGSSRTLGWDTPSGPESAAGDRLDPAHTVGHLGFTGCSLWVDLSRDLVVALLTNRVRVNLDPAPIRALRRRVHDIVADTTDP